MIGGGDGGVSIERGDQIIASNNTATLEASVHELVHRQAVAI